MLNGRLYDAATLNEVETGTRRRQPYFGSAKAAAEAPPRPERRAMATPRIELRPEATGSLMIR